MRGAISAAACCRSDDRLGLVVGARGRGEDEAAIGDRGLQRVVKRGAVENAIGAGRHHPRLVVGPGLARLDQPQPRQSEIRHGAGRGADILAELRLDQDHRPDRASRPSAWSCRCRRLACSAPRRANALKAQPLPKPAACVKRRHRIRPKPRRLSRTCRQGFYQRSADAIGRAPNSRQSNSRLAMSAPRTIHLRARGRNHSTAPANVQFPVGPNKHGDQRCKHARSRNHVDKGR